MIDCGLQEKAIGGGMFVCRGAQTRCAQIPSNQGRAERLQDERLNASALFKCQTRD